MAPHLLSCLFLFFFSSRRRHTRWPRDWSSDVCSSDLRASFVNIRLFAMLPLAQASALIGVLIVAAAMYRNGSISIGTVTAFVLYLIQLRSEERRVGKECRSWWSPYD